MTVDSMETPKPRLAAHARRGLAILLVQLGLAAGAAAETCTRAAEEAGWRAPEATAGETRLDFETLLDVLAQSRVVFVGESHDRYDHHLNQLEIICRLWHRHPALAVAVEFFQQPFQDALDDYVAGELDEAGMLRATEYFERWRYDYRLYEPILRFARERGIPVIALNLPTEITRKVGREGIDSLSAEERERIPGVLDRSDDRYRGRLRQAFEEHPQSERSDFDRFFEVQLLWDEGMAERAARLLEADPDRHLVVLAGAGHAIRSGIPARLARRQDASAAVVVHESAAELAPREVDFVLASRALELPAAGMLGVLLEGDDGAVRVQGFAEDSAAREAGIEEGDRIVAIESRPTTDFTDVKLALRDKRPGDTVSLRVERTGAAQAVALDVTLR